MRTAWLIVAALSSVPALADPIHVRPGGDYWHHDSNWIFPGRAGAFARAEIPQDVAGMPDATCAYALEVDGARIVAFVNVSPADSSLSPGSLAAAKERLGRELVGAQPAVESGLPLSASSTAVRLVYEPRDAATGAVVYYFVAAGSWRVSIRFDVPAGASMRLPVFDEFVRAQRWETLSPG